MNGFKNTFRRFVREDSAATMVEYGIMVALIAALAIAVIKGLGTKVNNALNTVNTAMP